MRPNRHRPEAADNVPIDGVRRRFGTLTALTAANVPRPDWQRSIGTLSRPADRPVGQ
jgi:hypothetical protein